MEQQPAFATIPQPTPDPLLKNLKDLDLKPIVGKLSAHPHHGRVVLPAAGEGMHD